MTNKGFCDKIVNEFENDYQFHIDKIGKVTAVAYKTKQQNFILECLKKHKNENLSADKIIEYLKKDGVSVGMSTVYRQLGRLCEDKKIRKFSTGENEGAVYRYIDKKRNCDTHFHLVCNVCNDLIHLECESIATVYRHIFSDHEFEVDGVKTVFYGVCKKCREER